MNARRYTTVALGLLIALLSIVLYTPATAQADAEPRTAFVHLFEWRWTDIAQECETFLGPMGYAAVQVSPPSEHATLPGSPWYQRYQPVSYQLESRSGTRAEFADMVSRCNAVGVDIYVDAVINHMAADDSGSSSNGSPFDPGAYSFPAAGYGFNDFHHCGRNGNDEIYNYQDRYEVQNCKLVGLPDLDTGSNYVRDQIAAYMNDLIGLGVDGFRIDAAKHMSSADIDAIVSRLNGSPYIFQEVIDQGGEAITAPEYFGNGDVTEFKYSLKIGEAFKSGQLAWLSTFGESWGFMPSDMAVVFTDNHDNQRGHGGGGNTVTFQDGSVYDLANVFMLAWPYGYPKVMSSYAFSSDSQGPPSDGAGNTNAIYHNGAPDCFDEWKCEHRWLPIANMVAFRNATSGNFFVTDWWDNGNDQVAFGRGDAGFVAINREGYDLNRTFQTSMAAGSYCNIIDGAATADGCSGSVVTVDGNGQATVNVPAMSAVAIHVNAVSAEGGNGGNNGGGNGFASAYSQVAFRGTPNGWSSTAMTLVADHTWAVDVTFSGAADDRFKFDIYGDWSLNFGDANDDGYADAGGGDITVTSAGDYTITFNDQTLAYTITQTGGNNNGGGNGFASTVDQVTFRGTPNGWATTAMTLVADHTWEVDVTFSGAADDRFKFDIYGDWSLNYGDNDGDGYADAAGGDIAVTAAGDYTITFNDQTLAYTVTQTGGGGNGGGTVTVTFNVNATTVWGQSVYVVGSVAELGNWNPDNALPLSADGYPMWSASAELSPDTTVEYKYIKKDGAGNIVWESGGSRVLSTPASGSVDSADSWR